MEKFTLVIESIIDTDDMIAVSSAIDDIKASLASIGARAVYARRGDFRSEPQVTSGYVHVPTDSEISEEKELNESGEMFGPNKSNPNPTGWQKVKAWNGIKDPTETRTGRYRQTFNPDGSVGDVEFLPDEEVMP